MRTSGIVHDPDGDVGGQFGNDGAHDDACVKVFSRRGRPPAGEGGDDTQDAADRAECLAECHDVPYRCRLNDTAGVARVVDGLPIA